jgi:hypothetical protein
MRTNPLIGPLIAVLCMPLALGIADTVTLASSSSGGTPPNKPACMTCTIDSVVIDKEKSILDYACGLSSKDGTPYAILTGQCQRYQCSNGYYYSWTGWNGTSRCTDHEITSTVCPEGSCMP